MDLVLLKLALERLNETIEKLKLENAILTDRVLSIEKAVKYPKSTKSKIETKSETDLLTTKEVLKILKVSHNTLQSIVKKGLLVKIRLNARNVRYSKKNLLEYINSPL